MLSIFVLSIIFVSLSFIKILGTKEIEQRDWGRNNQFINK